MAYDLRLFLQVESTSLARRTQDAWAGVKKCVGAIRSRLGKSEKTRFCILDAQRVKNTDTAKTKGYDADKKVSGIKRHMAVDSQGLIHAIALRTANVTNRAGADTSYERLSREPGLGAKRMGRWKLRGSVLCPGSENTVRGNRVSRQAQSMLHFCCDA